MATMKSRTGFYHQTGNVPTIHAMTLNWRGIIASRSLDTVKWLKLNLNEVELIMIKVVEGGLYTYANYMGTSGGGDVT